MIEIKPIQTDQIAQKILLDLFDEQKQFQAIAFTRNWDFDTLKDITIVLVLCLWKNCFKQRHNLYTVVCMVAATLAQYPLLELPSQPIPPQGFDLLNSVGAKFFHL